MHREDKCLVPPLKQGYGAHLGSMCCRHAILTIMHRFSASPPCACLGVRIPCGFEGLIRRHKDCLGTYVVASHPSRTSTQANEVRRS